MGDRDTLCGRVLGEFVVRERIGGGGYGVVYRCEQPLLGREAVVKVIHGDRRDSAVVRQRFLREAQLASRLDHPYAAHVYAFGVEPDDRLCWIAMEMVSGTGLDSWLRERGPLALEQLIPFFERVAEVVQTAHERGIVHRDLKPSNIMVIERAGRLLPKLLDFGIAKVFDTTAGPPTGVMPLVGGVTGDVTVTAPHRVRRDAAVGDPWPASSLDPRSLTGTDTALGSPAYMAPEQWIDSTRVGPRADLYALGLIAFEALTGHRPFAAATTAELAELHFDMEIPRLGAGFPPALDRVFQRALAKRAEDRPASALELAAMLRVASGFGNAPEDLPRLDELLRDSWVAEAPQSLAESVAALDGAHNLHQARDAARELFRELVRYLLALALAARAQVRDEHSAPEVYELLRALRRRELDDHERVELLRLLVRPFVDRRTAYPIPELVDLVAPTSDPDDEVTDRARALDRAADAVAERTTEDALSPMLALGPAAELPGEDLVRSQLAQVLPVLGRLMRAAAFVLDYPLVVPRAPGPERWMGLRRRRRTIAVARGGELAADQPVLLDRDGRVALGLWPLVQAVAASDGAERELFVFAGRGRHGARLIAAPAGFERHDAGVWEWFAGHLIGELDTDATPLDGDLPPYLGLAAFGVRDADRFVGREREVEAFANRLRCQPLLLVVGASGAGKSSFIHAGVIPALPPGWRSISLRPGANPLATLAARLSAVTGDSPTVIVVDQLEELFTLCADPGERDRFAAAIVAAASLELPTRVVAIVRDDFLMHVESLAPLRAALSPALFLLGNPSRHDLARTVVEPARRRGYELSDPELARDMVNMVADRPGALALLSFTAARLWELRDRRFRQLTRNAYDAMGGVAGALGQHAEDTFRALFGDDQRITREAFRHLVTADATRAVVSARELRQRLASPRADAVIDKLVAARLLAIVEDEAGPQIELVHEALIAAWPRLLQWTREDHHDARTRDQVRAAAKQWDDRGRSRELLWRGDLLVELERWRPRALLTPAEIAFADACRREARRARRLRRGVALAAFAVLGIVAAGASIASIRIHGAEQRAEDQAARATEALAKIQLEEQHRLAAERERIAAERERVAAERLRSAAETTAAKVAKQVAAQGVVIEEDRTQLASKNQMLEAALRQVNNAKQLAERERANAQDIAAKLAAANAKLQKHLDELAREKQRLTTTLK